MQEGTPTQFSAPDKFQSPPQTQTYSLFISIVLLGAPVSMNLGPGAISKLPLLPPHPRTSLNASSIFMCCAQILIFFHKFSDSEDSDDSDKITSPIIGICIHETIWVDFKTKVDFKRVNDFLCTFLNVRLHMNDLMWAVIGLMTHTADSG